MNEKLLNTAVADDGYEDGYGDALYDGSTEDEATWARPRGAVKLAGNRLCIGRVGAPAQQEATSSQFAFWVPADVVVEDTQLVTCESEIAGKRYVYYAMIESVRRRSRERDMSSGATEADGDLGYEPPFVVEGTTYAIASVLRIEPPVLTPPRERSQVVLAGPEEARLAYGGDEITNGLAVGLVKNGGDNVAGPGRIDLDYLLGANGGHMNVNGSAGRGTKSSLLLHINYLLLHQARVQKKAKPSASNRLRIVPIILNVKNFDLFYIDRWSTKYSPARHLADWQALGVDDPQPFANVTFLAAQQPGLETAIPTARGADVQPFSWSLGDVIGGGLLAYLFAESDANDANFGALVLDIENLLTNEKPAKDGTTTRALRANILPAQTFQGLLDWVDEQVGLGEGERRLRSHHTATWRKLYRRLLKTVYESGGVLRRNDMNGKPLNLVRSDTSDPIVVDLSSLAGQPEMQRFVVATILRQLVGARTGIHAIPGLVYLVTLDELNRFAPRGARDAITQLVEMVAAEMRSQGIILLGAQQQASKVSEKVIENAAIRVLGRTGGLELATTPWRFLSQSAQRKAERLPPHEKLLIQDNFREPMHVRVPFPVWAMNPNEAQAASASNDFDPSDFIEQ
jgi:hypothetical protein